MADKYKAILMFGGPGSGKGTQGGMLKVIPGFFHFSTGDMFRSMDKTSDLAKTFAEYSSRGELVPDELTVELWSRTIAANITLSNYKPGEDLLLLDGIPRTVNQAKLMDEHIEVVGIVYLVCNDKQAMVDRLKLRAEKEGRADDADESVVRNRWEVYEKETSPVLAHYPKDVITEVDCIGTLAEVFGNVVNAVDPIQKAFLG